MDNVRKINFTAVLVVSMCNPNGDPLNGNMPRQPFGGYGEITDVCIKHKIRNHLHSKGFEVLVINDEEDETVLKKLLQIEEYSKAIDNKASKKELKRIACENFIDVRAFGQVFGFKGKTKKEDGSSSKVKGTSFSVRGPIQIMPCISVEPVDVVSQQITKCISLEDANDDSDTMGMKHRVNYGIYPINGQINMHLAERTGLTMEDISAIKEALMNLCEDDESSARPAGSMYVDTLVWWEQKEDEKQYNAHTLYNAVHVDQIPINIEKGEYECNVTVDDVEGLNPEIIKL